MLQVTDATGLLSGHSWSQTTLTYGFPEALSDYPAAYDRGLIAGLSALPEGARDAIRAAVAPYDAFLALDFAETDPALIWPDIAASKYDGTAVAQAYLPTGDGSIAGDLVVATDLSFLDVLDRTGAPILGTYAFAVMLHELGHALGLKHPHELGTSDTIRMPDTLDGLDNTVMSYRSYVGDTTINGYSVVEGSYPQTPMVLDIAALQALYGADYGTAAGDTVYSFNADTGEVLGDGVSMGVPAEPVVFATLWDGGGQDLIDLGGHSGSVHIDLTPGGGVDLDTGGNAWRAQLGSGVHAPQHLWFSLLADGDARGYLEHATGGTGDDWLVGNSQDNRLIGGPGDDTLAGGAGNDALYGGSGADRMDGGDGSDIYVVDGTDAIADSGSTGYDKAQIRGIAGDAIVLEASSGLERVNGNLGDDTIDGTLATTGLLLFGNDGADVLTGGAAADVLIGGNGADTLIGGDGDDVLLGNAGDDLFEGGNGDDVFLIGDTGDRVADGGAGHDRGVITEAAGLTVAVGGWVGVERIGGYIGDDVIDARGLAASLTVTGNAGDDRLTGGDGDDTLFGGLGQDRLSGSDGADALIGAAGDDWLDGGSGDDFYFGGAGADQFVWRDGFGSDVVRTFETGSDMLDLTALTGVRGLGDLAITQEAAHTVIRLAAGGSDAITLADYEIGQLHADDFSFA